MIKTKLKTKNNNEKQIIDINYITGCKNVHDLIIFSDDDFSFFTPEEIYIYKNNNYYFKPYQKNFDEILDKQFSNIFQKNIFLSEINLDDLYNFPYETNNNFLIKPFNIILDIDLTLVITREYDFSIYSNLKDVYQFSFETEFKGIKKFYNFMVKFRPFLEKFLKFCLKYSNLYFCTRGDFNYAKALLKLFEDKFNIKFANNCLKANNEIKNNIKSISLFKEFNLTKYNTLIFDDLIQFWDDDSQNNIICSKQFYALNYKLEKYKFFYFPRNFGQKNNISEYFNFNNKPIYLEEDTFNDKEIQLPYIKNFIEKTFKYSLINNENLLNSFLIMKSFILKDCNINLNYYKNISHIPILKNFIQFLGAKETNNLNETTHLILTEDFSLSELKEIKKYHLVNIFWIINSFYFLKKMNENDEKYKINI